VRNGTQFVCCSAASRHRRPLAQTSKMDFRSNEAGRTASCEIEAALVADPISARAAFPNPR
jgi:hypothetical protein